MERSSFPGTVLRAGALLSDRSESTSLCRKSIDYMLSLMSSHWSFLSTALLFKTTLHL